MHALSFFHCAKGRRLRSAPFLLYRHRMQGVISHISSMALAIFWLVVVSFAIGGMILGFRAGLAALRDLVKKRNSE